MATYYTIDRRNTYQEGMEIELKHYPNISPAYLRDHCAELFPEGLAFHGFNFLVNPQANLMDGDCVIEIVLENIRKGYFPDKPSRFQSMFTFGTVEEAVTFRNLFGQSNNRIYSVEYDGETHKGNLELLISNYTSLMSSCIFHDYWSNRNTIKTGEFLYEYLLPLPQTIGKVVSE